MITTRYTAIINQPVEMVWAVIRDFNNYPAYIDGVTDSVIEDEKRGDEVGAVRRFLYEGNWMRQRLTAHSDEQRSLTYTGLDAFAYPEAAVAKTPPPAPYEGTMQLQRVVEGERTFIDWSVSLDTSRDHAETWQVLLSQLIADWTGSLQRALAKRSQ
jgi:hypothetical protein